MDIRSLLGIITAGTLSGCVALGTYPEVSDIYNRSSAGVSELDGSQHIRMDNIVCDSEIALALYQDTEMAADGRVLMNAGVAWIDSIGRGESLEMRVDANRWSFRAANAVTARGEISFGPRIGIQTSMKPYLVPQELVQSMASADELVVRVHLLDGTYSEASCTSVSGYNELTDSQRELADKLAPMTGIRRFSDMMDEARWQ